MDRICPFLALGDDLRTVVDGFDPDHRCQALTESMSLDRATQLGLCLREGHVDCPRFVERTSALASESQRGRVAADARFISTRLVLIPEGGWSPVPLRSFRGSPRLATGGAAAAITVAIAAAAATTNGFGLMAATSTPAPEPSLRLADAPSASPTRTPIATPSPSASATSAQTPVATPTVRPASPSPRPTPRTYIVASGDTLGGIAARFGTTIAALKAANGLTGDLINIGQVLVIP